MTQLVKIFEIEAKSVAPVKAIVEAPELSRDKEGKEVFRVNPFARQGYQLRDGGVIGLNRDRTYLYIKADEDFFKQHEKAILLPGVREVKGVDLEAARKKIEGEQESVAEGIGSVFEGF